VSSWLVVIVTLQHFGAHAMTHSHAHTIVCGYGLITWPTEGIS